MIRAELKSPIQPAYGAIPYRPDQVMHLQANISKLHIATGWAPQFSLEIGLRQTVARELKNFDAGQTMT